MVKANGSYYVGCRFFAESPIIDFVRVDSISDPLAIDAAAENEDYVNDDTTYPVAFFSTKPSISATLGKFLSIKPIILSSTYV